MEYFDTYDSPPGEITLCCDGVHLTAVFFTGQKYGEQYLSPSAVQSSFPVLEETKAWLGQYFHGNIPDRLPPIKLNGTPFQKCVWDLLLEIPYGETTTYGTLARKVAQKLGKDRMSAQAVGSAVGRNPVSILVPCHRVMGADGSLTGYAGGVDKKEYLLKLEKAVD